MTICASVKVRDAIVLGTDSMTTVFATGPANQPIVAKAYANAHKLFQIEDRPMAVMTYGAGNIGTRTVESLMIAFSRQVQSRNVDVVAAELFNFVKPLYDAEFAAAAPNQPPMGFFIAGYSPNEPLPEEHEFLLPSNPVTVVRPRTDVGAAWRGIDRAFSRLAYGLDPEIIRQLPTSGIPQNILSTLFDAERWSLKILFDAMPVQDAINFCEFILNTTIGAVEFESGIALCGGPLQIAVIRPGSLGFKWIAYPELRLRGGT